MNRQRALEILDAARPDSIDLNGDEFAEAIAYLKTDAQSAKEFARRQKFDEQIGRSMRNIAVPVNFKDQLLATLRDAAVSPAKQQESVAATANVAPSSKPLLSKKSVYRIVAGVAAGLLIAISFWFYSSAGQSQYEVGTLQQFAAVQLNDWQSLPSFSGSFSPALPDYGWTNSRIQSPRILRGLSITSEVDHKIALYRFQIVSPAGSSMEGFLFITEKSSVSNPPSLTHFSSGNVRYINTTHGEFAAVSWSDESQVYVCIVRDAHALERIAAALRSTPA